MDAVNGLLQPADLQAELDSLRYLRRRSLSASAEARIDPDLIAKPADALSPSQKGTSPPTSPTGITPASSDSDVPLSAAFTDLFWLPARLHPEIAPQEFRDFLREQTKPENLARRTSFGSNGHNSINRRRSTLSRQYNPSEEGQTSAENKEVQKSSKAGLEGLTIADLQRLEQLTQSNAPLTGEDGAERQQLQDLLQRSLSFGNSTTADDKSTAEGDSPLIVPAPGSILRRNARTKIRKPSLLGEGSSQRFGPSRRTQRVASGDSLSTLSDNQPETTEESDRTPQPSLKLVTHGLEGLPPSQTSASSQHARSVSSDSFLDAYTQSPSESSGRASWPLAAGSVPPTQQPTEASPESTATGTQHRASRSTSDLHAAPAQGLGIDQIPAQRRLSGGNNVFQTQPHETRHIFPHIHPQATVPGYPSPPLVSPPAPVPIPAPISASPIAGPSREAPRPDERKKSAWARLGLSKSGKTDSDDDSSTSPAKKGKKARKSNVDISPEKQPVDNSAKDKERERDREREKAGEGSFFGGLFAKTKKSEGDYGGSSQSRMLSPTASGMFADDGTYHNFYRLPIHVERAIYRLSHIKLANPRRALYEQVLISNLMFWYLSQQAAQNPKMASKLAPHTQHHNKHQNSSTSHDNFQPNPMQDRQSSQSNYDLKPAPSDMYVARPDARVEPAEKTNTNSKRNAVISPIIPPDIPPVPLDTIPVNTSESLPDAIKLPISVESRRLVADTENFEVLKRPRVSSRAASEDSIPRSQPYKSPNPTKENSRQTQPNWTRAN